MYIENLTKEVNRAISSEKKGYADANLDKSALKAIEAIEEAQFMATNALQYLEFIKQDVAILKYKENLREKFKKLREQK